MNFANPYTCTAYVLKIVYEYSTNIGYFVKLVFAKNKKSTHTVTVTANYFQIITMPEAIERC